MPHLHERRERFELELGIFVERHVHRVARFVHVQFAAELLGHSRLLHGYANQVEQLVRQLLHGFAGFVRQDDQRDVVQPPGLHLETVGPRGILDR